MKIKNRIFLLVGLFIGALCFVPMITIDFLVRPYQLYDFMLNIFEHQRTFLEILAAAAVFVLTILCIVIAFLKSEKIRKWRIAILIDIIMLFSFAVYFLFFTDKYTRFGHTLFLFGLLLAIGLLLASVLSTIGYVIVEKEINALDEEKNTASPAAVHRGIKRPAMFTGVLIATILFSFFLGFYFYSVVTAPSAAVSYFWVLILGALGVATLFPAVGIKVAFSSPSRYQKNKSFVLASFITDCLAVFILLLTYMETLSIDDLAPGLPFFIATFATAAVFTMIGYVNAQKETFAVPEVIAPAPLPPSPRNTKRPLMLSGEIIATITFGFASCYYLFISLTLISAITPILFLVVLISVTATVFSAMGIKIALSDSAYYQKRHGFVLASFILCCVGCAFILYFLLLPNVVISTVVPFLVLLCFATAAPLIMIGYVKAAIERYRTTPLSAVEVQESLSDIALGLGKFDELRKSGAISQEEFDAIKAKNIEKIK